MADYEFEDQQGNRYRIRRGAGPNFSHPENICSGSNLKAEEIFNYVSSSNIYKGFSHFYDSVICNIPQRPSHPTDALGCALSNNHLTLEKTYAARVIEDQTVDERPKLRTKIESAFSEIIANEKREAAMHQQLLDEETLSNKALIYLGGFSYGVYSSGKDLVLWLKEVSDLVNPVIKMQHRFQAIQAAWLSNTPMQTYLETYLQGQNRELVEALGFDPSKITQAQLDEAMAMASLLWNDPTLRSQLYKFIKDYASAQHSIELTEAIGAEALGVILTIILIALTAGAALPAAGINAVRKFKKLGELLIDYAQEARRVIAQTKGFNSKNKGPDQNANLVSDEIIVHKTLPPPPYKPHPKAVEHGPKAGETIHKRIHSDGNAVDPYTLQADGKPMGADAGKMPKEVKGLRKLPDNHDALVKDGWPNLNKTYDDGTSAQNYANFTDATPVELKAGETIYRVVDELNFDGCGYWARELPTNKTQWRKDNAVKDSWNDNGYYVEYTVKEGETIKAWEGGAAGQRYEKHDGKDFYLSGGGDQLYLTPGGVNTPPAQLSGWPEK